VSQRHGPLDRRDVRRRAAGRGALAALAALVVAGANATAQDATPAVGNYGGGAVVAPPRSVYSAGNMLIGLRVSAGRLKMNVTVTLSCSVDAAFTARATVAADGSFSARGSARDGAARTRWSISGTIAGAAASGTATARTTLSADGRTRRCPASTVRWAARRATGDSGAPPPPPKERYFGTTSQRLDGPRRAVALRISSDGTKLARALYDVTVRCDGETVSDTYDAPKRNLTIAADGKVRNVERFTFRNRATTYRSVERFTATIGAAGATGTFSTTARISDRSSGRTIRRCSSGTVRWIAAP
jgi:hypothetical protein